MKKPLLGKTVSICLILWTIGFWCDAPDWIYILLFVAILAGALKLCGYDETE